MLFEADFREDDVLVFGSEGDGLPPELVARHQEALVYVPIRAGVRSLNLANVVCLGVYTALDRSGAGMPSNDGHYEAPAQSGRGVLPASRLVRRDGSN